MMCEKIVVIHLGQIQHKSMFVSIKKRSMVSVLSCVKKRMLKNVLTLLQKSHYRYKIKLLTFENN